MKMDEVLRLMHLESISNKEGSFNHPELKPDDQDDPMMLEALNPDLV
jgi:hypothetical protein